MIFGIVFFAGICYTECNQACRDTGAEKGAYCFMMKKILGMILAVMMLILPACAAFADEIPSTKGVL